MQRWQLSEIRALTKWTNVSSCGVLIDEGFEDGGELFLLAAGRLRGRFEKAVHLAGRARSSSISSVGVVLTAE